MVSAGFRVRRTGFGWFRVGMTGFGWFRLVPLFSNYPIIERVLFIQSSFQGQCEKSGSSGRPLSDAVGT